MPEMPERIYAQVAYDGWTWSATPGCGATEYVKADAVAEELALLRAVVEAMTFPWHRNSDDPVKAEARWLREWLHVGQRLPVFVERDRILADALESLAKWQEGRDGCDE